MFNLSTCIVKHTGQLSACCEQHLPRKWITFAAMRATTCDPLRLCWIWTAAAVCAITAVMNCCCHAWCLRCQQQSSKNWQWSIQWDRLSGANTPAALHRRCMSRLAGHQQTIHDHALQVQATGWLPDSGQSDADRQICSAMGLRCAAGGQHRHSLHGANTPTAGAAVQRMSAARWGAAAEAAAAAGQQQATAIWSCM